MAPDRNKAVSLGKAEARSPMKVPNLYGLVGISSPNASEAEIQKAFEAIVVNKDEAPSNSVIAAYFVLSGAAKRAQYDRDRLAYLQSITNYDEFLATTRITDASAPIPSAEEQAERDLSIQMYAALLDGRVTDPREDKSRKVQARLHKLHTDREAFEEAAEAILEVWPVSQNQVLRMGANALRDVLKRASDDAEMLENELGVLKRELPPTDTDGPVGRVTSGQFGSEMSARFQERFPVPVSEMNGRAPSLPRSPGGVVDTSAVRLRSTPSSGGVGVANDGDGESSSSSSSSRLQEDTSEGMSQSTMPQRERIQKYLVGPSPDSSLPNITGVLDAIRKSHQVDNMPLRAQHRKEYGTNPVASPIPVIVLESSSAVKDGGGGGGESSKTGEMAGRANASPSGSTRSTLHKSDSGWHGVRWQGSLASMSQNLSKVCSKYNKSERIASSTTLTSLEEVPEHLDASIAATAVTGTTADAKSKDVVTPKKGDSSVIGLVAYQEHFGVRKLASTPHKQKAATTKSGPSNVHDYAHMTRLLSSTAPERPANYAPHRTTQDSGSPLPLHKRKKNRTIDNWDNNKKKDSSQSVADGKKEAANKGMWEQTDLNQTYSMNIEDMLKNMHSAPSLCGLYTFPTSSNAPLYMPPSASSPHSIYMPPTTVPPPPTAARESSDDFQSKRPGRDVFKRTTRSLKPGGTAGLPLLAAKESIPPSAWAAVDWPALNAAEALTATDAPSDDDTDAAHTLLALSRAADQTLLNAALRAKADARVAFGGAAFAAGDTSTLAATTRAQRVAAKKVDDEWTGLRRPKGYGHRYYSRDLRTGAPARAVRPFYFGDAVRPLPREVVEPRQTGKEKKSVRDMEREVEKRGELARAYEGALLRRRNGGLEDPFVDDAE